MNMTGAVHFPQFFCALFYHHHHKHHHAGINHHAVSNHVIDSTGRVVDCQYFAENPRQDNSICKSYETMVPPAQPTFRKTEINRLQLLKPRAPAEQDCRAPPSGAECPPQLSTGGPLYLLCLLHFALSFFPFHSFFDID